MPRRDFKYLKLILGRKQREAWMEDLATLRTKKLHGIANVFALSTGRISALSVAFSQIAYQVRRDQWCMDYAIYTEHGHVPEPLSRFTPSKKTLGEFSKQINKFQALPKEKQGEFVANWGAGYVNLMLKTSPGMDVSLEALFSSVVIESWIAFETLASATWVRAVDTGPAILRKRVMLKTPRGEKPDDFVELLTAEEMESDAQRRYGSALREARKVSFQRLSFIKRNYEIAFGKKIRSVFAAENGYVAVLAAFRNALIHNAGKADATFRKQVKEFPEFDSVKPNQKLKLDGELVSKMRNAATNVGAKLLHFVDDVLTPI